MSNELITYTDIEKMGQAVAKSGLFGVKTSEQAIALMLVAQAQGMHPATAAMTYHIIQGKPAKKSEAIMADFQALGGSVKWITLTDDKAEATFSHPQGGSLTLDWTIDRAKKAGLYDKEGSMYKKYPRQMLKARLIAEGVRAVYPAAMGGVRAVEEFDDQDTEDIKVDRKKSRLDNIIDATSEVKEDAKTQPEREEKPEVKEEKVKKSKAGASTGPRLAKGEEPSALTIQGLIDSMRVDTIEKDGKPQIKHCFKVKDKYYGTFDTELAKQIIFCVDNRVLVEFTYTERKSGDKTFQDIVSYRQLSTSDIPIEEVLNGESPI